ncbi:MAG TPA: nucleoside triphosphate pyrophosphohydrolase [Planctomycetota bacterium]|nr:nucleoside triphosphate pyrophosphohydrolase [Planctomycetota bacterium]
MDRRTAALESLMKIVDQLRGPGGCPWDKVQTLGSMSRYMLEEASEVADAVEDAGGRPSPEVCEELGDLLVNVLLASRIAEDERAFSVAEVASGISEKLIRRHPHVFAGLHVDTVGEVLANWETIKAEEKDASRGAGAPRASRLDAVPRSLPGLERAFERGKRAARAGFDWPDATGALAKVAEEVEEVRGLLVRRPPREGDNGEDLEEELGDLLFAVVSLCRKLEVRPEAALRRTLKKFCARFRVIEERIPDLEHATLDAMESAWQDAKGAAPGKERGLS